MLGEVELPLPSCPGQMTSQRSESSARPGPIQESREASRPRVHVRKQDRVVPGRGERSVRPVRQAGTCERAAELEAEIPEREDVVFGHGSL